MDISLEKSWNGVPPPSWSPSLKSLAKGSALVTITSPWERSSVFDSETLVVQSGEELTLKITKIREIRRLESPYPSGCRSDWREFATVPLQYANFNSDVTLPLGYYSKAVIIFRHQEHYKGKVGDVKQLKRQMCTVESKI